MIEKSSDIKTSFNIMTDQKKKFCVCEMSASGIKYISKEGEIDLKGLLEQTFGHNPGRKGKARKPFKH